MTPRTCFLWVWIANDAGKACRYSLKPLPAAERGQSVAAFRLTNLSKFPNPAYIVRLALDGQATCSCPQHHGAASLQTHRGPRRRRRATVRPRRPAARADAVARQGRGGPVRGVRPRRAAAKRTRRRAVRRPQAAPRRPPGESGVNRPTGPALRAGPPSSRSRNGENTAAECGGGPRAALGRGEQYVNVRRDAVVIVASGQVEVVRRRRRRPGARGRQRLRRRHPRSVD